MKIHLQGGPFDGAERETDILNARYVINLKDENGGLLPVVYLRQHDNIYLFWTPKPMSLEYICNTYMPMLEACCSVLNQNIKDLKQQLDTRGS